MDKITISGNDYEVLSLDPESIKQITHARLAGGKVVDAKNTGFIEIQTAHAEMILDYYELEDLGIQPLKLLERKPVEFVGEVSRIDGGNYYVDTINVPVTVKPGMKFRCVEIVEVTK